MSFLRDKISEKTANENLFSPISPLLKINQTSSGWSSIIENEDSKLPYSTFSWQSKRVYQQDIAKNAGPLNSPI